MADYIEVTLAAVNNCSVIADWDLEHVWELLMACEEKRGGPYRTFTKDFDWCLELYKEANEGMCAIITGDGGNKAACGSRFGCAWCTVTGEKDKSMEAMIASAPEKHAHMSGVNLFRNYLINTRWDMGKRDWLGRTYSDAGYISVTATAYSAAMRRELLRYLLTLDVLEEERAEEHDARMYRGELEDTEYNQTLRGCDIPVHHATAAGSDRFRLVTELRLRPCVSGSDRVVRDSRPGQALSDSGHRADGRRYGRCVAVRG